MTLERSKRRDFLVLVFNSNLISKKLLIKIFRFWWEKSTHYTRVNMVCKIYGSLQMLRLNLGKDVQYGYPLSRKILFLFKGGSKQARGRLHQSQPSDCLIRSFTGVILFTTLPLTRHNSFMIFSVFSRWGNCLVMVASQELREKALLGVHCDPNLAIIDIQYCLLEHIGQARYNGRMQRAIGSSFLKMEPKSLFHYLKGLRMLGLITLQAS